jgi:hypothetical protein
MQKLVTAMMMAILAIAAVTAQTKPTTDAQAAPSMAGAWTMTVGTPHGVMTMKLDLKVDGKRLSGTFGNDMIGNHDVTGEVAGGRVNFKFTAEGAGEMEFNGKLKDADSLVGTLTNGAGDMACSGVRVKVK